MTEYDNHNEGALFTDKGHYSASGRLDINGESFYANYIRFVPKEGHANKIAGKLYLEDAGSRDVLCVILYANISQKDGSKYLGGSVRVGNEEYWVDLYANNPVPGSGKPSLRIKVRPKEEKLPEHDAPPADKLPDDDIPF